MLTADLLLVRRKEGILSLPAIEGKSKILHLELAEQVIAIVSGCVGMTREQLTYEIQTIAHSSHEARIVKGYLKLVEEVVEFEQDRGGGAQAKREAVFERAAQCWQELDEAQSFERNRVLAQVAAGFEVSQEELEQELFVDLPGAQRVLRSSPLSAEQLLARYDAARVMALLLRAVKVTAKFTVASPAQVRELFRALRFRRLLFELEHGDGAEYRLTLTGPYSLFDAVTKYGLQLALVWPALMVQRDLSMVAELRWGKKNEPYEFRWESRRAGGSAEVVGWEHADSVALGDGNDELSQVRAALGKALPGVSIEPSTVMLDLPGIGICIPDLTCHFDDGRVVHLESMGYWSRNAVFQRVELVEAGLVEPVLFLVSSRLRVSEELLDETANGALYVYRGRINASTLAARIKALADRNGKCSPRPRARRLT